MRLTKFGVVFVKQFGGPFEQLDIPLFVIDNFGFTVFLGLGSCLA